MMFSGKNSPYTIYGITALILIILFLILFSYIGLSIIISYLISINLVIFLYYGFDKLIAGSESVRVPELLLHSLALAGGSPAGLLAQKLFRHKTIKTSFQIIYWLIVILQIILIIWLLF
jgi:uncharacterized membrane protein YsdA (DUF1294 family)